MTELVVAGNLALSRALGDFVFKKNEKKRPEEQIVTGKTVVCCFPFSLEHAGGLPSLRWG